MTCLICNMNHWSIKKMDDDDQSLFLIHYEIVAFVANCVFFSSSS